MLSEQRQQYYTQMGAAIRALQKVRSIQAVRLVPCWVQAYHLPGVPRAQLRSSTGWVSLVLHS